MQGNSLARFMDFLILVFIVIMMVVFATLPFLVDEYVKFMGGIQVLQTISK